MICTDVILTVDRIRLVGIKEFLPLKIYDIEAIGQKGFSIYCIAEVTGAFNFQRCTVLAYHDM